MIVQSLTLLDLGQESTALLEYFHRNGAAACPPDVNPAEYMLRIIKPPTVDVSAVVDWHQIWRASPEFKHVKAELARLNGLPTTRPTTSDPMLDGDKSQHQEFVASFWTQFWQVLLRTWKHFWRSPTYIWSKAALVVLSVSARLYPHAGMY